MADERVDASGNSAADEHGVDPQAPTVAFAVRTARLVRALPRGPGLAAVIRQLSRGGAGVGANVEEAPGAQMHNEFARRRNIARSEARETLCGLRLIAACERRPSPRPADILSEYDEVRRILVSIVKNTRARGGWRRRGLHSQFSIRHSTLRCEHG